MIRRCLACLGMLAEPCVHLIYFRTGVLLPHPEGLGQLAASYLATQEEV